MLMAGDRTSGLWGNTAFFLLLVDCLYNQQQCDSIKRKEVFVKITEKLIHLYVTVILFYISSNFKESNGQMVWVYLEKKQIAKTGSPTQTSSTVWMLRYGL